VDITDISEVTRLFELFRRTNKTDIIVVNLSGKKYDVYLNEITVKDVNKINEMLNVNIQGNINLLSACLPYMREKGWGRVIGISSVFADMNIPKNGIYGSTKAFMDRLYNNANRENAKFGITCNTIQLGYWDGGMSYEVDVELQEKAKNKIPLKRFGTVEELYKTIDFIIENEYISGENLKISGGL